MDMPQYGAEPMDDTATTPAAVKFCIAMGQDGTLTYYTERDGQPEAEMPAQDIGQALKLLLEAYRETDGGAEQGGFNSVAEPAQPGARPPRNNMQRRQFGNAAAFGAR